MLKKSMIGLLQYEDKSLGICCLFILVSVSKEIRIKNKVTHREGFLNAQLSLY